LSVPCINVITYNNNNNNNNNNNSNKTCRLLDIAISGERNTIKKEAENFLI